MRICARVIKKSTKRGFIEMARPWMPLFIADYISNTSHLGALESGAYLHLIMEYWQKGGLPDDDARLARIAKMTPIEFSNARATLAEFFLPGWRHKRVDRELAESNAAYKRRAVAGKAGGAAKSSNATAMLQQCSSSKPSIGLATHSHSHSKEDSSFFENLHNPPTLPVLQTGVVAESSVEKPKQEYPLEFEGDWKAFPRNQNSSKANAFRQWRRLSAENRISFRKSLPIFAKWLEYECARRSKAPPSAEHMENYIKNRKWVAHLEAGAVASIRQSDAVPMVRIIRDSPAGRAWSEHELQKTGKKLYWIASGPEPHRHFLTEYPPSCLDARQPKISEEMR